MLSVTNMFILIVVIIIFVWHIKRRKRHPPGPLGLPYVGLFPFQLIQTLFSNYLPKMSQIKIFKDMRQKYGDYWSMEMGGQRIVTLASYDIMYEAFVTKTHLFEGRPSNEIFDILSEKQGIMLVDGPLWRDNRHMAVKALKELGMGRKDLENHICDEAHILIEHLIEESTGPINSSVAFVKAVSNVISRLVFNEYNNYNDPLFHKFIMDLKYAFLSDVLEKKCGLFPKFFCTKLARKMFADVDKYFQAWSDLRIFVNKKCENKKRSQIINAEPSCVFDYFWSFRFQDKPNIQPEDKMNQIFHTMSDLYMNGTETTNTLLSFSFLMLGRYPDVQNDLRSQIATVTDDYKNINMNMRKDFPKILSFIDEIQRFCCLVPKFPRRMMKKCTFRGYELDPKDIIFGDWGTVSRDKTLFENPDVFDAYRFMDQSRTRYIPNKYLIPFGLGKRFCLGESMALMELFLFISKIILTFRISLPEQTSNNFDEILEGKAGFVHAPLDHQIKFDKLHLLPA